MPEAWAQARRRRRAVGVPKAVTFRTKWQIALEQMTRCRAEGVPPAPLVADAGYGVVTTFRDQLTAWAIPYVVGISSETTVWAPGRAPLPPRTYQGRGRPPSLVRRTARHRPLRVRPAHRDEWRSAPRPEEWLLIEWPHGEATPTKSWLSTLPPTLSRTELVRLAKLRWRIERDYEELKDELGLDHFEGRGWRGFHHHATLCSRGALPVRPERHVPHSLATLYRLLASALAQRLPCMVCGHQPRHDL